MKDRILQLMQYVGLSPSKFAETIDIKRSAMSHYMTGRNDPSVDVLKKIHSKYPSVNLEWLLTGNGEMTNDTTSKEVKQPAQLDIFANKTATNPATLPNKPVIQPKVQPVSENRREMEVERPQNIPKQTVTERVIMQKNESKQINKIMLFYSDNTYETFISEKTKKD